MDRRVARKADCALCGWPITLVAVDDGGSPVLTSRSYEDISAWMWTTPDRAAYCLDEEGKHELNPPRRHSPLARPDFSDPEQVGLWLAIDDTQLQ